MKMGECNREPWRDLTLLQRMLNEIKCCKILQTAFKLIGHKDFVSIPSALTIVLSVIRESAHKYPPNLGQRSK